MASTITIGPSSGGAGQAEITLVTKLTFNAAAEVINYVLTNTYSPAFVEPKNLANGFNTITLPTTPRQPGGVVILPQPEATYRSTLKGVTGDTGIVLHTTAPSFIPFHTTPPASFGLTWGGLGYNGTSVTADNSTDKITKASHGLANGDRVQFGGTALPGGITSGTWYYVINTATNDFEVSLTSNGSKVDITSNGTSVTITTADQVKLIWV